MTSEPLSACIAPSVAGADPEDIHQLRRLAAEIEDRVGRQRFAVWFEKSARLRLTHTGADAGLEIAVPNDFISDWIGKHFSRHIQDASAAVFGCSLPMRFAISASLFDAPDAKECDSEGLFSSSRRGSDRNAPLNPIGSPTNSRPRGDDPQVVATGRARVGHVGAPSMDGSLPHTGTSGIGYSGQFPLGGLNSRPRLRHDLESFVNGASNQVAYECTVDVADHPGGRYNPLFIHGHVGLGKTHLLQGLCRRYARMHPTGRWAYLTGEEFTNEFLVALRNHRVDSFRRKVRDLDLLVIDDVHFLGGKKATQEEFLHTFNAVEAMGKQVVMASDNHPKMIASFGESLINRFVSGMVVRVDPPNKQMRADLLRVLAGRQNIRLSEETIDWIATRITQNVRELEGAVTRIAAHVRLAGRTADVELAQETLGDLDRHLNQPVRPERIFDAVCEYFALEKRDLMSGRRQRTISLARSVAMYLVRKTTSLSYPEIAGRMGKRNHSTVISACRRIEGAINRNETLEWSSSIGDRREEAGELVQRLEEQTRARAPE